MELEVHQFFFRDLCEHPHVVWSYRPFHRTEKWEGFCKRCYRPVGDLAKRIKLAQAVLEEESR